jgi:uncharacterized protein YutE (UPF0331/DUF86 family)
MLKTNIATAKNKLELIDCYLERLKEFEKISLDDYLNNFKNQLIVERLLQLITQSAIDINEYILSKLNPENNFTKSEAFIKLSENNVIAPKLAKQLALSLGLKNHLIYEYGDIEPRQVFTAISFALQQYPLYVKQINEYLISLDIDNG